MGQLTYTWDELLEVYERLHFESQEQLRTVNDGISINPNMEQHLAQHALGMVRLIPKLRELPDLNETDKWTSHFALVMNSTTGLYRIDLSFDRDPAFVNLYLQTRRINSGELMIGSNAKVREEDVILELKDFLKNI